MPERAVHFGRSRAGRFIETTLYNQALVKSLVTRGTREQALAEIRPAVNTISEGELSGLLTTSFQVLGSDVSFFTQDRKDAVLEVLKLIDPEKLRTGSWTYSYNEVVKQQTADDDPFAGPTSLIEAGKILAPHMIPSTIDYKTDMRQVWEEVVGKFEGEDRSYLAGEVSELMNLTPNPLPRPAPIPIDEAEDEEEEKLGGRDRPDFKPDALSLHDRYLNVTKSKGSFKLTLWGAVPQFRALVASEGIPLERFWNLTNPQGVTDAYRKLAADPSFSQVEKPLSSQLKRNIGLGAGELSDDKLIVVADEVVGSVLQTRNGLLTTTEDIDVITERLRKLAEQATAPRARRSINTQVAAFFADNGVTIPGDPKKDAIKALSDNGLVAKAKEGYKERQAVKSEAAALIDRLFIPFDTNGFSLMSRSEEDLYLGDLTGDCTSYHLNIGFNAWTVPPWLVNPGFNFFKNREDSILLAKHGLILSRDSNGPILTIDSTETGKGIKDEAQAVIKIQNGLSFLRRWAESIGFDSTVIQVTTNSSDLEPILKGATEARTSSGLHVIGGLDGLSEARKSLTKQEVKEGIYLQSAKDENEVRATEQSMNGFETYINEFVHSSTREEARVINDLVSNADWNGLFKFIMNKDFPNFADRYGSNWSQYAPMLDQIEITPEGRGEAKRGSFGSVHELPIMEKVRTEADVSDDWDDQPNSRIAQEEAEEKAEELDELLIVVKKLEVDGVTPEVALRRLYGRLTADTLGIVSLKENLPRITI